MSGGSFNYLCRRDVLEFEYGDVQNEALYIAHALEALGAMQAALATFTVVDYVRTLDETTLDMMQHSLYNASLSDKVHVLVHTIEALQPVWKAVEWFVSGDWPRTEVTQACAHFSTFVTSLGHRLCADRLTLMANAFPMLVQTPEAVATAILERFPTGAHDNDFEFHAFEDTMAKEALADQFVEIARHVAASTPKEAHDFLRALAADVTAASDYPKAVFWFHGWANRLGQGVWTPNSVGGWGPMGT